MKKVLIHLGLLALVTLPLLAQAALKSRPTTFRVTMEELDLPGNEKMGLLGTDYLIHLNKYLYTGLGLYSAVSGERGGFFVGGIESGAKFKLGKHLELDAGVFVGGGGGGSAPQGGGLMVRPHIGVMVKTSVGKFGLQASEVEFPNGGINSRQVSLVYEKPLSVLMSKKWLPLGQTGALSRKFMRRHQPIEQDFSVLAQRYQIADGVRDTAGDLQVADMSLVGIEWDMYFSDAAFFRLQTLGAFGGGTDGFASLLFGLGYRFDLPGSNSLKIGATVGASGGGQVETGGGLTTDASVNLQHRFDNGLLIGARAGIVAAPDGEFEATSFGLYLGNADRKPARKVFTSRDVKPRHWRVRATHQTYLPRGNSRRKGVTELDNKNVDLIGLQTDIILNKYAYITGQAIGAYDGDAGGYAAGMIGGGINYPLWKDSRLELTGEVLVGAAGGGGLDVGDGLVSQAMLGLSYRTSRSTSLQVSLGRMEAQNGSFEADVVNVTFGFRFTTLAWR